MSIAQPTAADYAAAVWSYPQRTLGTAAVPPAVANPLAAAYAARAWAAAQRTLTTPAYSVAASAASAVLGKAVTLTVTRNNGRAFAAGQTVTLSTSDGATLTAYPIAGQRTAPVTYTPTAVGTATVTPSNSFGGLDPAPLALPVAQPDVLAIAADGTFDTGPVPVTTAAAYQRLCRVPLVGRFALYTVWVGPVQVAKFRVRRSDVADDPNPVPVLTEAAVTGATPAVTFPLTGTAFELADQTYAAELIVEAGGATGPNAWVRVYGRTFYPGQGSM